MTHRDVLLPVDVARLCVSETGWVGYQVVVMTAIAHAESGLDALAHNVNTDLTFDDGLFQLNSRWLSRSLQQLGRPVPTVEEYGPLVCTPATNVYWAWLMWKLAYDRFIGGVSTKLIAGYNQWNTYRAKAHLPFMAAARDAAVAVGVVL